MKNAEKCPEGSVLDHLLLLFGLPEGMTQSRSLSVMHKLGWNENERARWLLARMATVPRLNLASLRGVLSIVHNFDILCG
jgi:hypothetical protein